MKVRTTVFLTTTGDSSILHKEKIFGWIKKCVVANIRQFYITVRESQLELYITNQSTGTLLTSFKESVNRCKSEESIYHFI